MTIYEHSELKMTEKEQKAFKLSILLWGDMAREGHFSKHLSRYYPRVEAMVGHCPLCDLDLKLQLTFLLTHRYSVPRCKLCPAYEELRGCKDGPVRTVYSEWAQSYSDTRKLAAKAVRNAIIKAYLRRKTTPS